MERPRLGFGWSTARSEGRHRTLSGVANGPFAQWLARHPVTVEFARFDSGMGRCRVWAGWIPRRKIRPLCSHLAPAGCRQPVQGFARGGRKRRFDPCITTKSLPGYLEGLLFDLTFEYRGSIPR